ncbi:NAD(P)/FAD-dependent oxidoreductase [Caldinitratiruptor microaerophilus]|uniref:Pyridine nucleotide-disulfide oxidoreductase n=1 Tax=Caldinitratiruptor microaerophilus TaxID=671077 RepID=A0AA35G9K2_9FIRM|nr:FAD/NAD(P)-binding oxidoreductase [Caldinitratiruptor microaerophilus]BDG62285.1 pyridine nucleotide-disulfide oxidoreductase [Caldinitratiruptor microaerophilus]
MPRLLVIGAGTGGLMVANHVARALERELADGRVAITVLSDRDTYFYQPGLLYVPFDLMRPSELTRPVRSLLHRGIRFVHDRAERIDAAARRVQTRSGATLDYDFLVLATGSDVDVDSVPGLAAGGHWFYTLDGALRLREALRRFQGGRLVMAVGLPHKCPVAPLEFTFMFDEWTRRRGIRDKTEIVYTFPINRAHSIEAVGIWAAEEFERRGIQLETFFNLEEVDPDAREVRSLEGTSFRYDLLVAIPPHKGDRVHKESGLGEQGNWLPTDRHTLNLKDHPEIFVVGDATNLPVSKAGSVAHFEAEVVAENLINLLTGEPPSHLYDGKVFCFLEAGLDKATFIQFDYDHPPVVAPPTQAVHWFKQTYNRVHWLNLQAIV